MRNCLQNFMFCIKNTTTDDIQKCYSYNNYNINLYTLSLKYLHSLSRFLKDHGHHHYHLSPLELLKSFQTLTCKFSLILVSLKA
jgi:hypothetical protein